MKTFYVTTAIDYTNAKPHMGHAYEKICADVQARWHRLLGYDVFFLTGTDEHGQKVERAAKAAGKNPKEFVDELALNFKSLCKKLNISNDDFIRTTDKRHEVVAQKIFKDTHNKGDIYKGEYEGIYCTGCEAFYVEKDLDDGKCKIHGKKCELVKEESYFFKLSKYQKKVIDYIKKNEGFILPVERRNEILSRLEKEELRDLSVSRTSFKWGVPVPFDEKHVIYVWFEALINYISALNYPEENFKKFWPCDVHNVGKDILWFHTVIWPTMLFSAGIKLPKKVFVHGFINVGGEKLSKSKGLVIDPLELVERYGADPLRYFLLREIPFGSDGDFSEESLAARTNNELANDLGNLLMRVVILINKNFKGKIPKLGKLEAVDNELIRKSGLFNEVNRLMQSFEFHSALNGIWNFVKSANKYINETEPWKIQDKERLGTVLYNLAESLRIISLYLSPFIPETSEKIIRSLGIKEDKKLKFGKTTRGKVANAEPLFKKIELKKQEQFPLDLKVARILEVKEHTNADKLFVLQIDLGSEKRQLVAGLREHYSANELMDKKIIVVANLKYAKLRGIESQGMLLAGNDGKEVGVLTLTKSNPGDNVYFEGLENSAAKIDFDNFLKINMKVKNSEVYFEDRKLNNAKVS